MQLSRTSSRVGWSVSPMWLSHAATFCRSVISNTSIRSNDIQSTTISGLSISAIWLSRPCALTPHELYFSKSTPYPKLGIGWPRFLPLAGFSMLTIQTLRPGLRDSHQSHGFFRFCPVSLNFSGLPCIVFFQAARFWRTALGVECLIT